MPNRPDIRDVEVIAPNFKRRLSGVTSTIIQLVPVQNKLGQKVATLGPGLPDTLPKLRWRDLLSLWTPPPGRKARIWHARRNVEMLAGLVMRDLLRMKLKLVFTSASQRRHTGWTKFLISRMDAVIATSAKTASYLEVPCTVIMHGIDTERFSPPADKAAAKAALGLDPAQKYVGCFGRIRHQKGTDLFVDAMIALLPERPDWSAIIAGRATAQHVEFETELKEKVRAAGLDKRILFVGEHTNIHEWYRPLDLFVAPQRWEGFGLTPLEAMATGVPVVATDVGAFSELIVTGEGETGLLIPADSLSSIAQAAASLMNDTARRNAVGSQGRRHIASRFTIENEARHVAAVYRRTLEA
ncbi:glycosyltransferase family 4 protein [Shinella sp. PSBB067]|uniref:glycosyltransferase family 4 protein n=1 Tax=Shinella sp. PSBB067 TaxID=2715959 RepID=UPI00193AED47|nr:glycosyltransferase family 4 protein [Shinella sp. PSBB067]QRI65658.1 glycosyltransferase family 4 protein [Shinella sp. PSBB067]